MTPTSGESCRIISRTITQTGRTWHWSATHRFRGRSKHETPAEWSPRLASADSTIATAASRSALSPRLRGRGPWGWSRLTMRRRANLVGRVGQTSDHLTPPPRSSRVRFRIRPLPRRILATNALPSAADGIYGRDTFHRLASRVVGIPQSHGRTQTRWRSSRRCVPSKVERTQPTFRPSRLAPMPRALPGKQSHSFPSMVELEVTATREGLDNEVPRAPLGPECESRCPPASP